MTKLEELTAMMVNEIELFEAAVDKMEKIRQQQIRINSTSLEATMRRNQENLEKTLSSHKQEMKNLGYVLAKSKAYPVWALTLFVGSLILNGILIYSLLAPLF